MSIERRGVGLASFVVATVALGLCGVFAESCGGSESAPATEGTAGSGGSAGSTSATTTGGGAAGKAGASTTTSMTTSTTTITGAGGTGGSGGAGGTGGSAGSSGSGGSGGSAGKAGGAGAGGSAGKAGAAGASGSGGSREAGADAARVDGSADASDASVVAICRASQIDSGSSCIDTCRCDRCAASTVACFSNPGCKALVDCANANHCTDTVCAAQMCQAEFAEAGMGIALAQAVGTCLFAQCVAPCTAEAGRPDAASDASPE